MAMWLAAVAVIEVLEERCGILGGSLRLEWGLSVTIRTSITVTPRFLAVFLVAVLLAVFKLGGLA